MARMAGAGDYRQEWTAPDGARWIIECDFEELDGRSVCIGMTIRSADRKPRPLKATTIKALPFGRIADNVRKARWQDAHVWASLAQNRREAREHLAAAKRLRKRRSAGRPALPNEHYERAADVYNSAVAAGLRGPVREVARVFMVAHTTARGYVRRARERGLIA